MRRIIHVDQDCFYASVEMRDNPELNGIPLGIAGLGRRSVLTTCNYEARALGCHSAMPTFKALELCPHLHLVAPDFDKYQAVSRQIRAIFEDYTDLVEPLSLDEAYLDVSHEERSASDIAEEIRGRILKELELPSSAGVGPNKMLAKIASDWNKPNGQFEIAPNEVDAFMRELPVRKLWGVGPKTEEQLEKLGVRTCGELQQFSLSDLIHRFGKFGAELYALARGHDERPVQPHRKRKSMSVERTFGDFLTALDVAAEKVLELFEELVEEIELKNKKCDLSGIFLKVKFSDFSVTTVSKARLKPTFENYFSLLQEGIGRNPNPIRLLGVGVRLKSREIEEQQLDFLELLSPTTS